MAEDPAALRRRIGAFAAARRFQHGLRERWCAAADADAAALLDLAEELRLGENQLRDLYDWTEEIAARDGGTVAGVLGAAGVQAARARGLGRNEAIKAVREALRGLRFPQLAALERRLAECIRSLRLPPGVRIVLPEHLQGDEIRIEICAGDAAAVRAALAELAAAADRPQLAEVFALLQEAP